MKGMRGTGHDAGKHLFRGRLAFLMWYLSALAQVQAGVGVEVGHVGNFLFRGMAKLGVHLGNQFRCVGIHWHELLHHFFAHNLSIHHNLALHADALHQRTRRWGRLWHRFGSRWRSFHWRIRL